MLRVLQGKRAKGFPSQLITRTQALLEAMDFSETVETLRFPPSNRLEQLKGDRAEQHCIRVNKQWRICFRWTDEGAEDVEFVDYH
ncbi:MAG: type II toxin-antitoxin system RelE/ParE family toxin [Pseudomonadota bacterium]